jgi:hypothetical protein
MSMPESGSAYSCTYPASSVSSLARAVVALR